MAKILTDEEMGQIIYDVTHPGEITSAGVAIDDSDCYKKFLEDLGQLICDYFGGIRGEVGAPDIPGDPTALGWTCGFHVDENVPDDGGVFKDYDTDVVWKDGEESQ